MTDNVNEVVNTPNVPEPLVLEMVDPNDHMLAELRAAEAEVAAEQGKVSGETLEPAVSAEGQETKAVSAPQVAEKKAGTPMVPKPRFDEVLSERDLLRNQVGYLQGRLENVSSAIKPAPANALQDPAPTQVASDAPKSFEALIDESDKKMLELAEKFDNGEISTVELKRAEIEINKEIRKLSEQRLEQVKQESLSNTQAALTAQQQNDWIIGKAKEIQDAHPNVAVIDAVQDEHVRNGIWQQIGNDAAKNLAQRGINVSDGSPQSKVAFIQEKARLTERYTPQSLQAFLPEGFAPQTNSQPKEIQPTQKKMSDAAVNRNAKLDLANLQPPSIADMNKGTGNGELTESDIEKMDNDQIADLLSRAPHMLNRIIGNSTR
jgi:hypothetical protein